MMFTWLNQMFAEWLLNPILAVLGLLLFYGVFGSFILDVSAESETTNWPWFSFGLYSLSFSLLIMFFGYPQPWIEANLIPWPWILFLIALWIFAYLPVQFPSRSQFWIWMATIKTAVLPLSLLFLPLSQASTDTRSDFLRHMTEPQSAALGLIPIMIALLGISGFGVNENLTSNGQPVWSSCAWLLCAAGIGVLVGSTVYWSEQFLGWV